jgi:Fic family protein
MKEDILGTLDRGESITLMEPMLITETSRHQSGLADLAVELTTKVTRFRYSLPTSIHDALADLVRTMNCYYSNLIEGHDTHPVDIERALKDDFSADASKRNLQLEAKAHIAVQQWIDEGGLIGQAATVEGLCQIHRRFCELLPDELLWIENPDTGEKVRVEPGKLRDSDVSVGSHVAVSPDALKRFLKRFEGVYTKLGKAKAIIAAASAHHRLLWIHPFLDGNGRVARLMSHAMLLETLDTGGIWSVARGLARHVFTYKSHLANCDQPRRNDFDGRGNLSEEALAEFSRFFLEVCLDQVTFMEGLMQPERLRTRILIWAEEEAKLGNLSQKAGHILEAVLYRGELPRGEVADLLQLKDRQTRRIVSSLVGAGVLVSSSQKAPLRLAFPATLASRWMPGLFPECR